MTILKKIAIAIGVILVLPEIGAFVAPMISQETASLFGSLMVGIPVVGFFYGIAKFEGWRRHTLNPRIAAIATGKRQTP